MPTANQDNAKTQSSGHDGQAPARLTLFFDFISPYAFFAFKRVHQLGVLEPFQPLQLQLRPLLFAGLLEHWGQLGPAEIPPKRLNTMAHVLRLAHQLELPIQWPAKHPFYPITALRLALPQIAGEKQPALIDALFDAAWSQSRDIGLPEVCAEILQDLDMDAQACLQMTRDPAIKQILKDNTEDAILAGAFGVPTFLIDHRLFWGNDQLDHLLLYLRGDDPLSAEQLEQMAQMPPGIERRR